MKTVLFCEDNPLIALDLEQMIYDSGHTPVGPARTLDEALEIADSAKPDVALIDINLADGDSGARLARLLADRGIRIVVLSGISTVQTALAGIDHVFMAKPTDARMLAEILGKTAPIVPKTVAA